MQIFMLTLSYTYFIILSYFMNYRSFEHGIFLLLSQEKK